MKGFEITINGQKEIVAVKKGVVLITVSYNSGVNITGSDDTTGISLSWDRFTIADKDEIMIKKSENTAKPNPPLTKVIVDRSKLIEEYFELKDLLSKKGII